MSTAASTDTLKIQALRECSRATTARIVASAERIRAVPMGNVLPMRGSTTRGGSLSRSVLVIEDNGPQREIAVAALAVTLGVPVYGVATIAEAHDVLVQRAPGVVVLDWYLGRDTGKAFLAALRRDVRVIVRSGAIDADVARDAETYQATLVAKGSVEDRALAETVRSALAKACG